jgi:hypothetical protein
MTRRCAAVLTLAVAATAASAGAGPTDALVRQLRAAAKPLLGPAPPDASCTRSLVDVVGLAAQVSEKGGLPASVRTKLRQAHDAWSKTPDTLGSGEVRAALSAAYADLDGGRAFAFPASVHTIDAAREACRKQIDGAASALEAGRFADATRGMVEFVLTVTTPMEAPR